MTNSGYSADWSLMYTFYEVVIQLEDKTIGVNSEGEGVRGATVSRKKKLKG